MYSAATDFGYILKYIENNDKTVGSFNHAPTELVLTRAFLNVSKAGYALRCMGDRISDGEMQERQPALMQRDCGVLRRWLWQQSPTSQRGHLRLRFPILIFLLFFGFVDAVSPGVLL